ncbi:MAG: pyrroline-5-carboxylate reductase [Planctomycetota bacterium]|nr:pyrroline-5-carboxylate reductase [Planctomycetota bacterium]
MAEGAAESWRGKTLGVVGAGNMGEALVAGALGAKALLPDQIVAHDPSPERRAALEALGCRGASGIHEAAGCDAVLLAVKPQILSGVLEEAAGAFRPGALVVSIAAGIALKTLETLLPAGVRVVRVMPNTPLMVGMGMSALAGGNGVDDRDMAQAMALFAGSGKAVQVDERLMDAVTAFSGSGPAYLFRFAEALIAGGRKMGMDGELATTLAVQTLRGAAEMLARGGDPADLRTKVASPGGTTAAALGVFEERGFAGTIEAALFAALKRAEELGNNA